jgi:hypothetical protein
MKKKTMLLIVLAALLLVAVVNYWSGTDKWQADHQHG